MEGGGGKSGKSKCEHKRRSAFPCTRNRRKGASRRDPTPVSAGRRLRTSRSHQILKPLLHPRRSNRAAAVRSTHTSEQNKLQRRSHSRQEPRGRAAGSWERICCDSRVLTSLTLSSHFCPSAPPLRLLCSAAPRNEPPLRSRCVSMAVGASGASQQAAVEQMSGDTSQQPPPPAAPTKTHVQQHKLGLRMSLNQKAERREPFMNTHEWLLINIKAPP